MNFVSERALSLHKGFLNSLRLRCSAIEKSSPKCIGKSLYEISRLSFKNKEDIMKLRCEIMAHEIFFSSFGEMYQSSVVVKNTYRTEANFLYELLEFSKKCECEYVGVYLDKKSLFFREGNARELFSRGNPVIIIDICEHAYFLDYGFEKEDYLRNLIPYLNLRKLDENLCCKH